PRMVYFELEFDERDPLYKCCCGVVHVRTGARVLSVLNVLMSALMIIQLFFFPYNWLWSIMEFFYATASVTSSTLMFIATFTFRPRLVIGYLVTQFTIMVFYVLLFATCMVSIVFPDSVGKFIVVHMFQMTFLEDQLSGLNEQTAKSEVILLCFSFSCFLFITIMWVVFLLRVSFQCYNYLLDVRDARQGVSRLPPLRLEADTRGVFLVGLEH
ncbi:hypothetical protein PMAYCL1PPCAC_07015, partial [Pristionchus mayeri]